MLRIEPFYRKMRIIQTLKWLAIPLPFWIIAEPRERGVFPRTRDFRRIFERFRRM